MHATIETQRDSITHTHTMRTHMRSQRSTLGHRGTDTTIAGTRECTWEQTSRSTQVTQEASYDFHVPSWTNTMKGPGYLPGDRATGLWVPVLVAVAPYREFFGGNRRTRLGIKPIQILSYQETSFSEIHTGGRAPVGTLTSTRIDSCLEVR